MCPPVDDDAFDLALLVGSEAHRVTSTPRVVLLHLSIGRNTKGQQPLINPDVPR